MRDLYKVTITRYVFANSEKKALATAIDRMADILADYPTDYQNQFGSQLRIKQLTHDHEIAEEEAYT